MTFHRPSRKELAIHEAGHAYAYASLVWKGVPKRMTLERLPDKSHYGSNYRDTIFVDAERDILTGGMMRSAAAEIVVAMAGPVAEFRYRERSRDAGSILLLGNVDRFLRPGFADTDGDFDRMRRTIRRLAEPEDAECLLRSLIGVADEIVAVNWPSIGRLADELRSKGFLDEDCIFLWFREHQAKDCSTRELPIRTSPRDR